MYPLAVMLNGVAQECDVLVIGSFYVDTRLNQVSLPEPSLPPLEIVALYLNYKLDAKVHDDGD